MKKLIYTLFLASLMAFGAMSTAFAVDKTDVYTPSAGSVDTASYIGYVNVEEVMQNYPGIKDIYAKLDDAHQKAQDEFNKKAPSLDEQGRYDLNNKLTKQVNDQERALMQPVLTKIHDTILKVASEKGIKNVIDSGSMLAGGVDLTQDVIKAIK